MARQITPGRRVWVDRGGETLESMRVESVEGSTVKLKDTVERRDERGDTLVTIREERHLSEVWIDREEAIRDGVAHPEDWWVTSSKQKYWDAYYASQET